MIEAFTPHTPQKSFTDRIGLRSMIRRFEHLDANGCGYTSETGSKFAITIMNEIVRRLPIRGCLSQLLCSPGIGRRSSDTYMDDSSRMHIDNEKSKQRAEKEVCDLQEITRPDVLGMVLKENSPCLSSSSRERAYLMYF